MATSTAKPNGVGIGVPLTPLTDTTNPLVNPLVAENETLKTALREAVEKLANAPKAFDSYFSVEYQTMLAGKYDAKYSLADKEQHRKNWPDFIGNPCVLYILAGSTHEARCKVFSNNKPTLVRLVTSALEYYAPTTPGAILTEMQVKFNSRSQEKLLEVKEQIPDDDQMVDLLKVISRNLHTAAKTGKELEVNKEKFSFAAQLLGHKTPSTLW